MQRAVLTKDGFLFLEVLGACNTFSDGDITLTLTHIAAECDVARLITDIDAFPSLADRVARIRAAMDVSC